MNNPRGGRDCDKEKELMGEAGNMGREKRERYISTELLLVQTRGESYLFGKSFCTMQTSCQTTLQEKLEQRQLWEGAHLDWDCIAIHNSKLLHIPPPISGK